MRIYDDERGSQSDDQGRQARIHRLESDLAILSGDRMKIIRKKTDRELELKRLRNDLHRLQMDIDRVEAEAKRDVNALFVLEEEIRLAKKKLKTV